MSPADPSPEDLSLPPVLYEKLATAAWMGDRGTFLRILEEQGCPWDLNTKVDLWKILGGG